MATDTSLPIREWMQPIDDAEVFVRTVGGFDGGPVLVLAHGGPGLSHDYLRGLEALASEWLRVVLYDQRGVGRSTGEPTRGDPIAEYAEELDALRRALDVEQISVLGHSAGGFNGIAYGSTHPERTASLIFVDSVPPTGAAMRAAHERQRARIASLQEEGIVPNPLPGDPVAWLAAVIPAFFSDPGRPGLVDALAGTTYSPAAAGPLAEALGGYDYDLRPLVSRLTMPVLNVLCEIPHGIENGLELSDALPPGNSDRLVLTGQGHLPWIECPDLFYPRVQAFLAGITRVSNAAPQLPLS
jgi:pimeloyl-ACP methyl ester carboxylesterase